MKNSFLKDIWSFITSLKLTIIVLILLSFTSIIGTIVPQNELPSAYLKYYSASTVKIIQAFEFDNMYHSWWFTALLALFTLNLICCSLNRFPSLWRIITRKEKELDDQLLQSLPLKKTFRLKALNDHTRAEIIRVVKKHIGTPSSTHFSSDSFRLFAGKGKYTRLGFYITHLGIVLIIAGGIIGNYGYQGYMNVVEGETNDTIILRGTTQRHKIGFDILCNEFEVTYYEGSRRPKDFKSSLTIIDDGKEVVTKLIEVNDPLSYKGVYIYQSSYGTVPDKGSVSLSVAPKNDPKNTRSYKAKVGNRFSLEENGYEVLVKRFVPDFTIGQDKQIVSRSQELRNPAVQLEIFKGGALIEEKWIFAKFPDFHGTAKGDYQFKFLNFSGTEYTGLQLTRDPGVWTVWIGCILLTLGCYLIFFLSHRRLWIKVENRKGEFLVTMAGTSNKNMLDLRLKFEKIYQGLKTIGSQRTQS